LLALPVSAADSPTMLLERALQLDAAAGDTAAAAQLYLEIVADKNSRQRTTAEALFYLADLRTREAKYEDARDNYTRLIRDFPDARDLIPLANEAWSTVTSLMTRDQFATRPAATHRIGDLVIALRGALDNAAPKGGPTDAAEAARARVLVQRLAIALKSVTLGSDKTALLSRLQARTNIVETALADKGAEAARAVMAGTPEFETFMLRGFPADPHDLFAPAWRLKDKLARSLAGERPERAATLATQLEKYLAPVAGLPAGIPEAALARAIVSALHDIKNSIGANQFAEGRVRIDALNEERDAQYADVHRVATLPIRVPEEKVAAEWVVLFYTDLARTELSRRGVAVALDHIAEARKVCHEALPGNEKPEITALFKHQEETLRQAGVALQGDQLGLAMQALKRVNTAP
jgi:hypothetical protein